MMKTTPFELAIDSRSMEDICIGDIYQVRKPWSVRTTDGKMLVMVVEKHKYYAQCRPILFPSVYGMSKPYYIDFNAYELKESNRVKSYEEARKWIYKQPTFIQCDGLQAELVAIKEAFRRRIIYD